MNKMLEKLWNLLPDKCQVSNCCRKGVLGNENRHYLTSHEYIIICDYCTVKLIKHHQHRSYNDERRRKNGMVI